MYFSLKPPFSGQRRGGSVPRSAEHSLGDHLTNRLREDWELDGSKRLYEFFVLAIGECTELARELRFDKTHQWHMALVTLYGSILELSHAIRVQIGNGSPIGVPILLRSQLEAFVDFVNLAGDQKYGYHIDAANLREWKRVLTEAKTTSNPYLRDISEFKDLDVAMADHESKLMELEAKGYRALNNFEKFDRSGQAQEYRSFYNFLCCHTHNNMRALIERHIEFIDDGADIEVQFFAPAVLTDLVEYYDSAAGILVAATIGIHEALKSEKKAETEALSEKLQLLRKPWTEERKTSMASEPPLPLDPESPNIHK